MNDLFDAARTLSVSGAALPAHAGQPLLTPVRLSGKEALGELFDYTLELKTPESLAFSPSVAANLELDKLIGTEVTVSIQLEGKGRWTPGLAGEVGEMGGANIGAGTREITGLVAEASLVREEGRSVVYALTLRSWLWLATKNRDCRLFQDSSVVEITDAVLAAYPFPVEWRLTTPRPNDAWPKRDLQRQHWESDFKFLRRLWEEWGIYFWFEHGGGKHRLVLCDSIGAHEAHGPAYETIRYAAPDGKRIDEEHIHALTVTNTLTTGVVTTVDYDYTHPRADLTTKREDPRDTGFAMRERYTWGDYAQSLAGAQGLAGTPNEPLTEGEYLALVQVQAERCQGSRARGQGNLRGLTCGRTFSLTHYPQEAANREYLVVSSKLDVEEVAEESGTGQRYRCVCDFEIQPSSEVFRSLRGITKPRTHGPETARVVGPAGEEIWTDAYGRVKVQFIWDRQGRNDERSSCWVRVASSWQGDKFGALHVPRIGQEVIVNHLNGDPDLPIITNLAVNALHMPSWQLPGNRALSGFRSHEIGGERANHLVLDDTHGKIQAQLSSDHALSQLNLGSITRVPGNVGRQDARGEGFELRTDAHGVMRAAQGMLVTTERRSDAQGHAKDMGETVERLASAHRLHDSLAQAALQSETQETAEQQSAVAKRLDEQNQAIRGAGSAESESFPELSAPHLVLAGKAGVEMTTPASVHIASGEDTAISSEGHVSFASGGGWFATIRNAWRVLVIEAGMKLVAAAGDIVIEALKHSIHLRSPKEINLEAEVIRITATKQLIVDGGGSYVKLEAGLIEQGTVGQWVAHAATHGLPEERDMPAEIEPKRICIECLLKASSGGSVTMPR